MLVLWDFGWDLKWWFFMGSNGTYSNRIYPLVMTNSLPWYRWPIEGVRE